MTQTQLDFTDITANRHKGHRNSVAAHERVKTHKVTVRERIRIFLVGCGHAGATLPEIAQALMHPTAFPPRHYYPNEISGRCTELKLDGVIFESGRTRNHADILVADSSWVNGSERG